MQVAISALKAIGHCEGTRGPNRH